MWRIIHLCIKMHYFSMCQFIKCAHVHEMAGQLKSLILKQRACSMEAPYSIVMDGECDVCCSVWEIFLPCPILSIQNWLWIFGMAWSESNLSERDWIFLNSPHDSRIHSATKEYYFIHLFFFKKRNHFTF